MRLASIGGRAKLIREERLVDVALASEGRFPESLDLIWEQWAEFDAWARGFEIDLLASDPVDDTTAFDAPVRRPRQVFAIGLNYRDHAEEAGLAIPSQPLVFTKFASSITGPDAVVVLSGERVDWEAELVVVIGRGGRGIPRGDALAHIAGVMVGQDLSDRTTQNAGSPPQFSLGKSYEGYAPTGPWVVTLDELPAPDASRLRITCDIVDPVTGERRRVQNGLSSDMVFGVEELIEHLSAVVELYPGDLIFTGTPAGVGIGRKPHEFLSPGLVLETTIEHVGTIRQELR